MTADVDVPAGGEAVLDLNHYTMLLARRRWVMLAAAAAFGLIVLTTGIGHPFDRAIRDLRDRIRMHPASGQVHLIEIDAKSLKKIDRWPWPRSVHAAALDILVKDKAQIIAFDVDFSASSDPAEDRKLAQSLARAGGSVILPTFRQQATSSSRAYIDSTPAKPFIDKAFLGAVTIVPDSDDYVRHMPLGIETAGTPRPSLASMVAGINAEIGRFFEIDYAIDPATIPRDSFVDLVEGRVQPGRIAGKRVIIGATAVEMGDRYVVPAHGVLPGVVVQALAAETLLQGPVPRQFGPLLPLLLALLLTGLCVWRGTPRARGLVFLVGGLVILTLPLATESSLAVSLEIAPAMAALAAAALVAGASSLAERHRARALADARTGLPNLFALSEETAISGMPELIVVARIDRFNAIAAALGADGTARLVTRVAERLHMANFERPIYRTDDATLAWIENAGDGETLEDRLEAINAVMRSPVESGRLVDVSLNIGMAGACGDDVKQVVANASLAALHAARKGLRWEKFNAADSDETNWHLSLLSELDAAMSSGQVWNAYQPQLDLATGNIVGAEALVRWFHPQRGPIAPDNFIPMIESHGRARDLTFHVLVRALEDAVRWEASGRPIGISVNVSATLLADVDFIDQVRCTLQASDLRTECVTLEVTESAAMNNPDRAIAALESWRALGINISIDDYGIGQSSLNYLQKLPATELKIDKSFVRTITSDVRNAIMVRSTIALAHELGIKVVAEGIEDADCLSALVEMGCDTGQGYHIGRPMSASNLSVMLGGDHRDAA